MSLLRRAGRVAVASSIHGNVQRRQQQKWSAQDQAAANQAAQSAPAVQAPLAPIPVPDLAPAPPAAPALDTVDEVSQRIALLTQLGELHAAGVLTDAELAQQKARVLG